MSLRDLHNASQALRQMQWERDTERRAARRWNGKLVPATSQNRAIAEAALVREPLPGNRGAELWITYSASREAALALRADRAMARLELATTLLDPDALNGYVAFPKRNAPRVPRNTGNIVQYIPVHGGITWAVKDSYMAVWGFDTMHWASSEQPRSDRDWIRANCHLLYRGLLLAEELWPEFRRATQERRAELAQRLLDLVGEQPLIDRMGFQALIGLLTGRVG
jgi:hypothetical protein